VSAQEINPTTHLL